MSSPQQALRQERDHDAPQKTKSGACNTPIFRTTEHATDCATPRRVRLLQWGFSCSFCFEHAQSTGLWTASSGVAGHRGCRYLCQVLCWVSSAERHFPSPMAGQRVHYFESRSAVRFVLFPAGNQAITTIRLRGRQFGTIMLSDLVTPVLGFWNDHLEELAEHARV